MNETNKKKENQKPKVSKLAKVAFLITLLSILSFIIIAISFNVPDETQSALEELLLLFLLLLFISLPVSFILGCISIIMLLIKKWQKKGFSLAIFSVIVPLCITIYVGIVIRNIAHQMICGMNLSGLAKAVSIYVYDFEEYPEPNKWCDLLIEHCDVTEKQFICPGAKKARSHYAINPACKIDSPNDVVLLFETKGGWNQFGGPELLTLDNHGGKGCIIVLNDSYVDFVKPEDIGKLKWKVEEKSEE